MSSHPLAVLHPDKITTLLTGYRPASVFILSAAKMDKVDTAFKLGLAEGSCEIGFPCQKTVRQTIFGVPSLTVGYAFQATSAEKHM